MSTSIAEQFYQSLLSSSANPQARRSVEKVWQACAKVGAQGAITVSAVGQACEIQFGGPKTQSIRNAKDTLRKLVDLCRDEQTLPNDSDTANIEDRIGDPSVRAYVRTMMEEVRQLRESEKRLRAAFKTIAPPIDVTSLIAADQQMPAAMAPPKAVTQEERDAIRRFLEPEHLFDYGFVEDKHGRISTEKGMVLIERPVVSLLRRLAEES